METSKIDALRVRAEKHVDMGDLNSAEALYKEILLLNANDTDAHYMLGVLYAESGDIDRAIQSTQRAIELSPEYPDSYFIMAKVMQVKQQYNDAFENCLKATSLDDEFDEAWLLLCALSTQVQGNEQAVNSCSKAIKYYPDSVQSWSNLAGANFNMGNYEEAAASYQKVVQLDPNIASAWKYLCLSLQALKEFDKAIEALKQALKYTPEDVFLYNILSQIYLELGRLNEAVESCSKAVEISPNNIEACNNMGVYYQKKENHEKAIIWFQNALKLSSEHAAIYHNAGMSYMALHQNKLAIEMFHKALELNPDIAITKHMLDIIEGTSSERPSNEYISHLFDTYALNYDEEQKDLQYQVPKHINDSIREIVTKFNLGVQLDVLDLGCGTGLCAPYIEDICATLAGVDLSPHMIKKAEHLDIYNELVVDDMSSFMDKSPESFDLVFAADVFIYIGDLEKEFLSTRVALRDDGFFVFSVQVNDKVDNYELEKTGRYNHAETYISRLAKLHGLKEISNKDIVSRVDFGVPVKSRVHVLQKMSGS